MGKHRPYIGPSEAQSNADALARRGAPYTAASTVSFSVQWDFHRRQPENLREAVFMVRRAYADEVPPKLHEGADSIGPDGTPKMTARAEGYIFGAPDGSDRTDADQIVSYYHAPFRAHLSFLERGGDSERHRAGIVSAVAIGSQGPIEAAMHEGVPAWCAKTVAWDALCSFLASMTDMKLHVRRMIEEGAVQVGV